MQTLAAPGLSLEPLTVAHAEEMFSVLAEVKLYDYLDYGPPPSVEHVRGVYSRLEQRQSPDGSEQWLNWVLRLKDVGLIGFVQATVTESGDAWVAYFLSGKFWGKGYARSSTAEMIAHLRSSYACTRFLATVEVANHRSVSLLKSLSFNEATPAELEGHELSPTESLFVYRPPLARTMGITRKTLAGPPHAQSDFHD